MRRRPGPARAWRSGRCRSPRSARRRSRPRGAARRRARRDPRGSAGAACARFLPSARSSSVSPTQRIGRRPAASAAGTFRASARSVSPKSERRSEWPSTTPWTPISASIGGDTSPVKAPSASECMFWAYSSTREPRAESTIARRSVKGTQRATSTPETAASSGSSAWMYRSACASVLYIFQLPAISGTRAPGEPPGPRRGGPPGPRPDGPPGPRAGEPPGPRRGEPPALPLSGLAPRGITRPPRRRARGRRAACDPRPARAWRHRRWRGGRRRPPGRSGRARRRSPRRRRRWCRARGRRPRRRRASPPANGSSSKAPIGPFQKTVPAASIVAA